MAESDVKKLEARVAELEQRFDALVESYEDLIKNPTRGLKSRSKLDEAKRKPKRWTL